MMLRTYRTSVVVLVVNRKGRKSLNVLVTAGYDHQIYDVINNAPGSFHDAAIWRMSEVKPELELIYPRVHVLGDSAFPMSRTMIIPFDARETAQGWKL